HFVACTAQQIDALLWIADDASATVADKRVKKRNLKWAGILEFVDEPIIPFRGEGSGHMWLLSHGIAAHRFKVGHGHLTGARFVLVQLRKKNIGQGLNALRGQSIGFERRSISGRSRPKTESVFEERAGIRVGFFFDAPLGAVAR